jgi:hypothetical protein
MEAISSAVITLVEGIVTAARDQNADVQNVLVGPVDEMFVDGHSVYALDVVVPSSNPTEFYHHSVGLDVNGTLALVMRSALVSCLEENFGSVQIFGHRLAFLRHCHLRWPNDPTLKAEYNKHMVQRNIN